MSDNTAVDDNENLTFVLHDEDAKDSPDRVVHEPYRAELDTANEPSWTIYNSEGGKNLVLIFGTD